MASIKALQAVKIKRPHLEEEVGSFLNYQTLFCLFMLGSVAGFTVEGVCHIFKAGYWENHSSVVWGPFCIIYGIGAIAVYVLSCCLLTQGWIQKFMAVFKAIYCALLSKPFIEKSPFFFLYNLIKEGSTPYPDVLPWETPRNQQWDFL